MKKPDKDRKPLKIAVSAGELSGDEHAAALVREILRMQPSAEVRGMGGRNLRAAGAETVIDSEKSASVMGFLELFGSLGKVLKSLSSMKTLLREWAPDLLILVDFPDFNMRLARFARSLGIPVFYYIPPKVWAWRSGRVKALRENTNHIAVIFPFEAEFFRKNGLSHVTFVGHPFHDTISKDTSGRDRFLTENGFDPQKKILAVFPGSRVSEISRHLGIISESLRLISARLSGMQVLVNVAPSIDPELISSSLPGDLPLKVVKADPVEVLKYCDAGLLKSGTSNLQAAFCDLPFVMFYITSAFSAAVARTFLKISEYSLVNILKSGTVREIIQEEATPENVAAETEKVLFDESFRSGMLEHFALIREKLTFSPENTMLEGSTSAPGRAALLALGLIKPG